jgi:alkylresorcinol/alkylpyrone synthase
VVSGTIAGFGSAFPPSLDQGDAWDGFFAAHYGNSRVARRVWRTAGVDTRHTAVDPRLDDLSDESTASRMDRFEALAVPLACEAVLGCLAGAGVDAADVGLLTVASCTGYVTPGIDILVARELGMSSTVQRLHVGHMGCYAALPALAGVADAAAARDKVGVLACVELTSLHLQPPTDDIEQMVAHALFSDAAAAVTVVPGGSGLELVDFASLSDVSTAGMMTWRVTDLGFRMRLSPKVSSVLDQHVEALTKNLLEPHDLGVGDVAHWAIHPGGPRIIETVARRLALDDDAVAASREVLRAHGNCSSATILMVLDELVRRDHPQPGEHIVAMAFGPGLTLYAALLRAR